MTEREFTRPARSGRRLFFSLERDDHLAPLEAVLGEVHCGRVLKSDFDYSYSITLLAFSVALRLSNADFAPFMKFSHHAGHPQIPPHAA